LEDGKDLENRGRISLKTLHDRGLIIVAPMRPCSDSSKSFGLRNSEVDHSRVSDAFQEMVRLLSVTWIAI
jgi:hypothetical protein